MTLRLAMIGCGAIATRAHLPALAADGVDVDVVAFAGRTLATAEAAAAQWGGGDVTDDWRTLLDRDDIDAVDICTPNMLHAPIAVAFAQVGRHVLVEKPLAPRLTDAQAMVDAADAADVVLMAAHNARFAPPFLTLAAAVAEGRIGEVVSMRAAFGHSGPQAWAPDASWFTDPARSGGGALVDLGVHIVDTLRAITGHEFTSVSAVVGEGAVERVGHVAFRTDRDAVGSFTASWAAVPGPDHQCTLHGTEGTLHLDSRTAPVLERPGTDRERLELVTPDTDPYANFVAVCLGQAEPVVTGRDGLAAVAVIDAAYRSNHNGEVAVEPT